MVLKSYSSKRHSLSNVCKEDSFTWTLLINNVTPGKQDDKVTVVTVTPKWRHLREWTVILPSGSVTVSSGHLQVLQQNTPNSRGLACPPGMGLAGHVPQISCFILRIHAKNSDIFVKWQTSRLVHCGSVCDNKRFKIIQMTAIEK